MATITDHAPTPVTTDGLWMPSRCPVGRRFVGNDLDAMVDAYVYTADEGGKTVTTHYACPVCGHTWSVGDWPAVMVAGLPWPTSAVGGAA